MLGKRFRHCKDAAAHPESGAARTRGDDLVEPGKAGRRDRAVPARHGLERYIEFGLQTQPAGDLAQLDDLDTHRKRRH
jgi:hypothetical protein